MSKKPERAAANNLRAWREYRGWSQEELAGRIKPPSAGNTISQLESGERGLSEKWLYKLADALGTTAGFLLDHDPRDIDAAFVEEMMRLPKDKRDQALGILRVLRSGTAG